MLEEKYIVYKKLPKNYRVKEVGSGVNGVCYQVDKKTIYKEFSTSPDLETLRKLSKIKSNYFVFPSTFIYFNSKKDENLLGYLMRYVNGFFITEPIGSMNIVECIDNVDGIENEMKRFSIEHNLLVHDIHDKNMLFGEDGSISIIDTDSYEFDYYNESYDVYKHNIKELANTILYMLLRENDFKDDSISNYYNQAILYGRCKPSYVLYDALAQVERETREKITTFDEFTQGLKLIKK